MVSDNNYVVLFGLVSVIWLGAIYCHSHVMSSDSKLRMRFLITVNDTWDPDGCIATVASPMLIAGMKYNETPSITVGNCDHGPLTFSFQNGSLGDASSAQIYLTFYSSVILDASPPTCLIPWNGSYINPKTQNPRESPLPTCWTADSREGYHMTFYWFRIMEWDFL